MSQIIKKYAEPGEWEVVVPFTQEGEEKEWIGVVDARKAGEYSLLVVARHTARRTRGRITVKAVCSEESVVKIKGVIQIGKEAQETDDFLELRVLTLGAKARATAEPELEIEANNVKASHAASVGGISWEQLRYLQSKGLTEVRGREKIIEGWLGV